MLESPLGGKIRGDLRVPGTGKPRDAIVVVHGFKGFKDWGFFPFVCENLAREGYWVVSFDFSHNGVVEGEFRDLDSFSKNTFTREVEELKHVLDLVVAGVVTGGRPRRVGLLGHSRGGADAILAAGEGNQVDALVTWGAVDHLDRWTEDTLREWRKGGVLFVLNQRTGQKLPLSLDLLEDLQRNEGRLDPLRAAESIRVPWLVIHGREDETIPYSEGERLARVSSVANLELLDHTGHTFGAVHPFQGTTPALDQALRLTVQHFSTHLGSPPLAENRPMEPSGTEYP